jgi:hypothetical protein
MVDQPHVPHLEVRHEPTDVSVRWILWLLAGGVLLGLIINVAIWFLFQTLACHQDHVKQSPFPLAPTPNERLPAEPRLEQLERTANPSRENAFLRQAAREAKLKTYGHTEQAGYVHIPIDRAMTALAGKLPVRQKDSANDKRAGGLVDAGASNAGRLFRGGAP